MSSSSSIDFAGQQYVALSPRSLFVNRVGVDPVLGASSVHVATIVAAPSLESPAAEFSFIEWPTMMSGDNNGEGVNRRPLLATTQRNVRIDGSAANVTSVAPVAFGEDLHRLSFVVSLSDETLKIIGRDVDEDDLAVGYRTRGFVLRQEGAWTSSCVLHRGAHGGRVLGARRDGSLAVVDLENDRLELAARLVPVSSGLTSFPLTQLTLLRGNDDILTSLATPAAESTTTPQQVYQVECLALCHTSILLLRCVVESQRLKPPISASPLVRSGFVTCTAAWRWSPLEPLESFSLRDNLLFAGSSDGTLVVWNIADSSAASAAANDGVVVDQASLPILQFTCVPPRTTTTAVNNDNGGARVWNEELPPSSSTAVQATTRGVMAPTRVAAAGVARVAARHATDILTGSYDGAIIRWHRKPSFTGLSTHTGAAGTATAYEGQLLYPQRMEGGSLSGGGALYGYASIVGLESTDQYMCAVDDSGVVLMWQWRV